AVLSPVRAGQGAGRQRVRRLRTGRTGEPFGRLGLRPLRMGGAEPGGRSAARGGPGVGGQGREARAALTSASRRHAIIAGRAPRRVVAPTMPQFLAARERALERSMSEPKIAQKAPYPVEVEAGKT